MLLGMEVGLSSGDFVLVRDPAALGTRRWALKNGAELPIFGPFLLWPYGGWIKMSLRMELCPCSPMVKPLGRHVQ